jgi:hypothetical protein
LAPAEHVQLLADAIALPAAEGACAGVLANSLRAYFHWTGMTVGQPRATNAKLERRVEEIYRQRP